MDDDGQDQDRLTTNPAVDTGPAYSPAGNEIVFSSNRTGTYELHVMDPDGTGQADLTAETLYGEEPDWGSRPE